MFYRLPSSQIHRNTAKGEAEARVVRRARLTDVRVGREEPKAWTNSRNVHNVNMAWKIL